MSNADSTKRDYYEVLGIDKNASEAEIKSAFRKKAKELQIPILTEEEFMVKYLSIEVICTLSIINFHYHI